MSSDAALAIDFGTTRTKVAYYDRQRNEPRLVRLGREGGHFLPSVFYVPEGDAPILVGHEALQYLSCNPAGAVLKLKRDIHNRSPLYRQGRSIDRVRLCGELFAYIRKKCETEKFHGQCVDSCNLTFPVDFSRDKRSRIRRAAEEAGFRVLQSIDEPVAAARHWLLVEGQPANDSIIVCDIGGGTTDIALVRFFQGELEVAPEHLDGLEWGVNDIDEEILESALRPLDPNERPTDELRPVLLNQVRSAREELSAGLSSSRTIAAGNYKVPLPGEVLRQCVDAFVKEVRDKMRDFLTGCAGSCDVASTPILLVGGGALLPGMQDELETLGASTVRRWDDGEVATVFGAVEETAANLRMGGRSLPPQSEAEQGKGTMPARNDDERDNANNFPASDAGGLDRERSVPTADQIRAMLADGRCEDAFHLAMQALVSSPAMESFELWFDCANAVSETDSVLESCRNLPREMPEHWRISCLAVSLANVGRFDEAIAALNPTLKGRHKNTFPVRFAQLSALSNDTRSEEYRRLLEELLAFRPSNSTLLTLAAEQHCEADRTDEALEVLSQARASNPTDLAARLGYVFVTVRNSAVTDQVASDVRSELAVMERIASQHPLTKLARAIYHLLLEEPKAALAELSSVVEHDIVRGNSMLLSNVLVLRARCQLALDDVLGAKRSVHECLHCDPDNTEGLMLRGEFALAEGRNVDAWEDYDRCLKLAPNSPDAYVGRGWSEFWSERYDCALDDFSSGCLLGTSELKPARFGMTCSSIRRSLLQHVDLAQLPERAYLFPNIPDAKLESVYAKYVSWEGGVPPPVALLYDDTIFGSAADGFCITDTKLYWHNQSGGALFLNLSDIESVEIRYSEWLLDPANLFVDGNEINVHMIKDEKPVLRGFVTALKALAQLHREPFGATG